MKEGTMYRVIDGETVEMVRWGDKILRVDDPLLNECIGQLVLELYEDEE
jgi:hypothetical protein